MKISLVNLECFSRAAREWEVNDEHYDVMEKYLLDGFGPGSFFTAILANDFMRAMRSSHPSNRVYDLRGLAGWITTCFPVESWGSMQKVADWLAMSPTERRRCLEKARMLYTEEEEVLMLLKS